MGEFVSEYGNTISQIGVGGFAIYALVHVWNRLVAMSDAHRQELKDRDDQHALEIRNLQDKHQREVTEIVARNMDEHRERNRVQMRLGMAVADAFARHGLRAPDPYPDVDDDGKSDPRK